MAKPSPELSATLPDEQRALARLGLEGGESLVWRRADRFLNEFELARSDEIYGEMANSTRPGFDAWGECFGESWEIRLERGFLLGKIEVTLVDPDAEGEGARYEGWFMGSGKIHLPTRDEPLEWGGPLLSYSIHRIRSPDGVPILRLKPHWLRGALKETRVMVHDQAWALSELPRLLLLGWFLKLHKETTRGRVFRRVKEER